MIVETAAITVLLLVLLSSISTKHDFITWYNYPLIGRILPVQANSATPSARFK